MAGSTGTTQRVYGKRSWTPSGRTPTNYLSTTTNSKISSPMQSEKGDLLKKTGLISKPYSETKNTSKIVNSRKSKSPRGPKTNKSLTPSTPSVIGAKTPVTKSLQEQARDYLQISSKRYPNPRVQLLKMSYLQGISSNFEKQYVTHGYSTTGQNNNCLYHSIFSHYLGSEKEKTIYLPVQFIERVKEYVGHDSKFGVGGMADNLHCQQIANVFGLNIAVSTYFGIEFYIGNKDSDDVAFIRHIGNHFESVRLIMLATKLPDQDSLVLGLAAKGLTTSQVAREYQQSTGSPIVTNMSVGDYIKSLKVGVSTVVAPSVSPDPIPLIKDGDPLDERELDAQIVEAFGEQFLASLSRLEDSYSSMLSIISDITSDVGEASSQISSLVGKSSQRGSVVSLPGLGERAQPLRTSSLRSIPLGERLGEMVRPLRASLSPIPRQSTTKGYGISPPSSALPYPTKLLPIGEVKVVEAPVDPGACVVPPIETPPEPSATPNDVSVALANELKSADELIKAIDAEIGGESKVANTGSDKIGEDKSALLKEGINVSAVAVKDVKVEDPQVKADKTPRKFPPLSKTAFPHKDLIQDASVLFQTHPVGRFFPDKAVTKQVPTEFDKDGKATKVKNITVQHKRELPDYHCSSYGYNYLNLDPESQSSLPVKIIDTRSYVEMHEEIKRTMGKHAQFVDVGAYAYAKTQMIGKSIHLQNKHVIARHVNNYLSRFDMKLVDPITAYLIVEHTVVAVMHINGMEVQNMRSLKKLENLKNVTKLCDMSKGMTRTTIFGVSLPKFSFKLLKKLAYPVKHDK